MLSDILSYIWLPSLVLAVIYVHLNRERITTSTMKFFKGHRQP